MVRLYSALLLPAAALMASSGVAQTPQAPLGGPPVAGVCLLSQQAVFAGSKVGASASARLKQLADQAQAEVDTQRAPIVSDAKALEAQRASLKPADFQQREGAIGTRLQALQAQATQRGRQIEATRRKILGQIADQAQPVIAAVYARHRCGLLLDRQAVIGGNMTGDITADVVAGLDARITTMSFNLETVPAAK